MIRIVVMGLIGANLLYFAWSQWVGRNVEALTAVKTVAVQPAPAAPAPPPGPPPCAALGPFHDELLSHQAQQKLEAAGWGVLPRAGKETVREGWWVTVHNTNSGQQARTLNAIRRAGIQDAFAMPDDPEFRVSV